MGPRPAYATKTGRMTAADKAEIERIAATMRKPKPGPIAQKVGRHPATVTWYMLSKGLLERRATHAQRSYTRNGKIIHPYTAEADLRIEQLRTETPPRTFAEIATIITREFGIERTGHSVQVRLVQLSADPTREFA